LSEEGSNSLGKTKSKALVIKKDDVVITFSETPDRSLFIDSIIAFTENHKNNMMLDMIEVDTLKVFFYNKVSAHVNFDLKQNTYAILNPIKFSASDSIYMNQYYDNIRSRLKILGIVEYTTYIELPIIEKKGYAKPIPPLGGYYGNTLNGVKPIRKKIPSQFYR
jgi:hypothetical protein